MLYQHTFFSRLQWRCIIVIAMFVFAAQLVHAQEIPEQKSYTAPREVKPWIFFGNSETSRCEYEQKTVVRIDPEHLRIRIKETPLKGCYYEITRTKMWEKRSIQGYSDSLRLHPQFDYEGYEKYGYTIFDEVIDIGTKKYAILSAADYDLAGVLIGNWIDGIGCGKSFTAGSTEKMLVDVFSEGKP